MRRRLVAHVIHDGMRRRNHARIRRQIMLAKREEQPNVPSELRLTTLGKVFPLVMIIAIILLLLMYASSYGLIDFNALLS